MRNFLESPSGLPRTKTELRILRPGITGHHVSSLAPMKSASDSRSTRIQDSSILGLLVYSFPARVRFISLSRLAKNAHVASARVALGVSGCAIPLNRHLMI
jgi:hypothetical protein